MSRSAPEPSVLVVLSHDFGELWNAMSLLSGLDGPALLLLPPRLAATAGRLAVRTADYRTADDVLAAAASERPDVVLLFSGYLFGVNEILDEESLARLVGHLRATTRAVATSDPFLGVMSAVDDGTFSDRHPLKPWLTAHFGRVAATLRDVAHVYVVPPEWPAARRSVSFYNPRGVIERTTAGALAHGVAAGLGIDPAKPRWMFVLSTEDYAGQVVRHGAPGFAAILAARLEDALRGGRQPVLVAPAPCVEQVRRAGLDGAVLVPQCGYGLFAALLREAECAFYWNIFSSTIPLRLMRRAPFLFFDRGHLARVSEPTFRAGLREYYRGSEVVYLDPRTELLPEVVDAAWRRFDGAGMAAARLHFARSPDPQAMLESLLRHTPVRSEGAQ